MRILIKLAIYAGAFWVAVLLVPGLTFEGSWLALLGIAAVFAVINAIVKPITTLLSLPLIILTLGLFYLIVNAAMLALTIWLSGLWDLGLETSGFIATFLGAIVISVVVWFAELLVPGKD